MFLNWHLRVSMQSEKALKSIFNDKYCQKKVFAILLMDADASGQTSEVEATRLSENRGSKNISIWSLTECLMMKYLLGWI